MAQNILSKVFGHEYEYPVADIEEGGSSKTSAMETNESSQTENVVSSLSDVWCNLYPNPNAGTMTIEGSLNAQCRFIMYDIWGKVRKELQMEKGYNKILLELPDVKGGIYIYQIRDTNGSKLFSGRIVVTI